MASLLRGLAVAGLAAAAVGAAVSVRLLAAGARSRWARHRRLGRILPDPPAPIDAEPRPALRALAAVAVGLGVAAGARSAGPIALVLGGVAGAAALALVGPGLRRWQPQPSPPPAPEGLAAALDLLAACLLAGCPLVDALAETAASSQPAVSRPLREAVAGLRAGLPSRLAWEAALGARAAPAMARLARACVRSERGGTPLEAVLTGLAREVRADADVRAQTAARGAGVLAVLPLGLCFLPAYLLLGVVPAVAGLVARLR